MPLDDVIDLMQAYARHGIRDWRSVNDQIKRRARKILKNALAEREDEAMHTIASLRGSQSRSLFIPMPKPKPHKGIQHSFFLPLRDEAHQPSFDLLLLCTDNNCLGFRFEQGHRGGLHSYGHIQMNRKMLRGDNRLEIEGLPAWVPTSYPAFPLCTSEPVEMFLSMVTSIHGYKGGMTQILQTAFAPQPGLLNKYLTRLSSYLAA